MGREIHHDTQTHSSHERRGEGAQTRAWSSSIVANYPKIIINKHTISFLLFFSDDMLLKDSLNMNWWIEWLAEAEQKVCPL
jgi:hypothetical protein